MLNKKMLLSVLIIGVVATAAGAGTWAYYQDIETSEDNQFAADTMDLIVNGQNGDALESFEIDNIVPGETVPGINADPTILTIENAGNVDGKLKMEILNYHNFENTIEEPEIEDGDSSTNDDAVVEDGELAAVLWFTVQEVNENGNNVGSPIYNNYASGLFSIDTDSPLDFGDLDGNEVRYFSVSYSVATDVTDVIQTDSVEFDIKFTLDQDVS